MKELRLARSMTLADIGGGELSTAYLSMVENGKTRISLQSLLIIASRLEVTLAQLVQGCSLD
jgi:transcriptional regulator with XRE-family HTH domain